MNKFIFLIALVVGASSVMAQTQNAPTATATAATVGKTQTPPVIDEKMQAATAYEKVAPVEGNIQAMVAELKQTPPFSENPELLTKLMAAYDLAAVKNQMIALTAKHFTMNEIIAMKNFYSTPEGQSIYHKMPAFMADFMPVMQQELQKAFMVSMQSVIEQQMKAQSPQSNAAPTKSPAPQPVK